MWLIKVYLSGTKDNSRCRTSGTKDNSCRTLEVDRRCTYKPLSLDEDESIFSTTVYDKLKRLEHVSLLCFHCHMEKLQNVEILVWTLD